MAEFCLGLGSAGSHACESLNVKVTIWGSLGPHLAPRNPKCRINFNYADFDLIM